MATELQEWVAEIPGLYGAFSFPEKLLQKIWLRGNFNRSLAQATDGRAVRIVHPGAWNLLGGPDFRRARFALGDGREIEADVEIHLRAGDWEAHGHARDAAYRDVGLHVVLFPPEPGCVTSGVDGRPIPILALLPLLHHDLEEFAAEEAVEQLANRPTGRIVEELGALPRTQLLALVASHAQRRWDQKIKFAALRVNRLGWESACQHSALEILGYRFNRAPMLRVAGRWPLWEWRAGGVDPERAYEEEAPGWSLHGVRPANHPRKRLQQYARWTARVGAWPDRLVEMSEDLPGVALEGETRALRRREALAEVRAKFGRELCGGELGGTRLDNLICDGLLPLLSARTGRRLAGLWYHWFTGDQPAFVAPAMRQVGLAGSPAACSCHGAAQGLLGWTLERERRDRPWA